MKKIMSKTKSSITIGIANEGMKSMTIDVVEKWEPKKVSYIGQTVFFEVDGGFVSMNRDDFDEIFKK